MANAPQTMCMHWRGPWTESIAMGPWGPWGHRIYEETMYPYMTVSHGIAKHYNKHKFHHNAKLPYWAIAY
jgi:hypothetical protein